MNDFKRESWRVAGPLTVREVPGWHAGSLAQRARQGMPAVVDLRGVEESDSSALALLLEWLSWAREAGRGLEFRNAPDSLRVLAELSDTDDLLGWSEQGTGDHGP